MTEPRDPTGLQQPQRREEFFIRYLLREVQQLDVGDFGTVRYRTGTVQYCTAKHNTGAYRCRIVRSFLMFNSINK